MNLFWEVNITFQDIFGPCSTMLPDKKAAYFSSCAPLPRRLCPWTIKPRCELACRHLSIGSSSTFARTLSRLFIDPAQSGVLLIISKQQQTVCENPDNTDRNVLWLVLMLMFNPISEPPIKRFHIIFIASKMQLQLDNPFVFMVDNQERQGEGGGRKAFLITTRG